MPFAYDYYLVGEHILAVDRTMAQRAIEMRPDLLMIRYANRVPESGDGTASISVTAKCSLQLVEQAAMGDWPVRGYATEWVQVHAVTSAKNALSEFLHRYNHH